MIRKIMTLAKINVIICAIFAEYQAPFFLADIINVSKYANNNNK